MTRSILELSRTKILPSLLGVEVDGREGKLRCPFIVTNFHSWVVEVKRPAVHRDWNRDQILAAIHTLTSILGRQTPPVGLHATLGQVCSRVTTDNNHTNSTIKKIWINPGFWEMFPTHPSLMFGFTSRLGLSLDLWVRGGGGGDFLNFTSSYVQTYS